MLLAAVLFLTEVWGYSVLHAGLALAPGPADGGDLRRRRPAASRAGSGRGSSAPRGALIFAAGLRLVGWRIVGADPALRRPTSCPGS